MTRILRRRDADRFSEVLPAWAGATAVIIGGGPSLSTAQVECVGAACAASGVAGNGHADGRRVYAIAVNDAYRLAPFAEVLYFADSHWWEWHRARPEFVEYAGQKCTIQNSGANVTDEAVHMLRNAHHPYLGNGLSLDPGVLVSGRNSGFQALNLAILAGAKSVLLLGFDGRPDKTGRTHWFGEHPRPTPASAYEHYRRAFSAAERMIAAAGVRVLNCSPGSGIDSFPKVALENALDGVPA